MNMPSLPIAPQRDSELIGAMREWLEGDIGRELLVEQQAMIEQLLAGAFGYHLLQVGIDPQLALCESSSIRHRLVLAQSLYPGVPANAVVGSAAELPFEHHSLDLVVLHHALDFTDNPHQVLREAARVTRPGGHLIVVGFNPFSWWGLRKLMARKPQAPWQSGQFIGPRRLLDWCQLLGLTELESLTGGFLGPFSLNRKLQSYQQRWLPSSGAVFALLVRKDEESMTPIRRLRFKRRFIALPVTKPATRGQLSEGG